MTELEARITNRGTDTPERIAARLALARQEMAASGEFDHLLINHQVDEVIQALVSLAAS
jgi:guanylate kinase